MSLVETETIYVTEAHQIGPYALRITFGDSTQREINFEPFLRNARNPLIQVFLEPARFATFCVRDGDLMWGDYELVFPVADLYDGKL